MSLKVQITMAWSSTDDVQWKNNKNCLEMDTNWEKEERQVKNHLVEEWEIGSCVACVYRIMDARLKFKEERKY